MAGQDRFARNVMILAVLLYGAALALFVVALYAPWGLSEATLFVMLAPWPVATVALLAAVYVMLRRRARRTSETG